jgi:hypothetical protein
VFRSVGFRNIHSDDLWEILVSLGRMSYLWNFQKLAFEAVLTAGTLPVVGCFQLPLLTQMVETQDLPRLPRNQTPKESVGWRCRNRMDQLDASAVIKEL